jgi:hypothetical protein
MGTPKMGTRTGYAYGTHMIRNVARINFGSSRSGTKHTSHLSITLSTTS